MQGSYTKETGRKFFNEPIEISNAPKALFEHSAIIMSHGVEEDPIYNYGQPHCTFSPHISFAIIFLSLPVKCSASFHIFSISFILPIILTFYSQSVPSCFEFSPFSGNQATLDIFGCDWEKFITLPSRVSVKPELQEVRNNLLNLAKNVCVFF